MNDRRGGSVGRRSRRAWLWPAVAIGAALVVFALYWFQPQKLFIDETVDEAVPTVPVTTAPAEPGSDDAGDAGEPDAAPSPPDPAEPVELARGSFISRDHGTSGVVRVLELSDTSRVVRLEDLDTDNGPDLFVYLSTNPADGPEAAFEDDYVSLGRLAGNKGNQNYEVPADVDVTRFTSIVIWCDRFSSAFGAADLSFT